MINYDKLVQLMLPTFLRKAVLIELLKTLVGTLTTIHTAFLAWYENARYKANATASVLSLTHHINREFATIATIEELDGKPTDFLVTTVDVVDEMRLRALINDYKIAGKSFTFSVGTIAFASEFSDWQCENIIEIFTSEFSDWLCEDDRIVVISGAFMSPDETEDWEAIISASRPVKSEITITGDIKRRDSFGNVSFYMTFERTIPAGETSASEAIFIVDALNSYFIDASSIVITPTSDTYYNYIYNG